MADSIALYRARVDKTRAQYRGAIERTQLERSALEAVSVRQGALQEAQTLAQSVATQVQSQAHRRIAEIVTSCLAVVDEPYTFKIDFKRARGKTEAHLLFERDGVVVDPLTAAGGGVVDVAAFALRLACLVMRRPPLRRVLVLDEPFKHLSKEYRPRMARMVQALARDLGVQFIIVTHDPQLQTGKVVML